MIQKETTGTILRKLRGDRTQEEIATALGITKSSWAMYERDERVPRDEVKIRIAKFFGKSVEELFYTQIEHYMYS
jgi:DNA-binding XRE family transcriptional regulator